MILKGENKKLNILLNSIDRKGKIVLDLGTGTGNVLQFLNSARVVVAIDSNFSMLQVTKRLNPNVVLIQADASNLPIKLDSIHIVIAIGLSEYVREIEMLLKEISLILKRNSFLVFTFSPRGFWTRLRLLLGHSIYPRTFNDIKINARKEHFQKVSNSRSLMQEQVLFRHI